MLRRLRQARERRLRAAITPILTRQGTPDFTRAQAAFDVLQRSYPPAPQYGYDALSAWNRAIERAHRLVNEVTGKAPPGLRVLEAGCGDAMTGALLHGYAHAVTLTDMDDWRDQRAKSLPIVIGRLEAGLPLEASSFDLIYSYNTLEHVADPAAAHQELLRLCRSGGLIHYDFAPLFASPHGLHAWTLRMPYPQYLFSDAFLERKLLELGNPDLPNLRTTLQPLNRWRAAQFVRLWEEFPCKIVQMELISDFDGLRVIRQFPEAFRGRSLTFQDVTCVAIRATLRKR